MSPTVVYLISGSNRGIGFALVLELVKRSDVVIFAGARDPSKATDLNALAAKHPGKIHVVRLVSADVEGNKAAAKEIERKCGRLDVVISSAGIGSYLGLAVETPPEQMVEHFNVNVNGSLVLFQATHKLLQASSHPKFIFVTSGVGSLTAYIKHPGGYTCYGASKAALNYVGRKIHFENPWLTSYLISPGVVRTDMAKEHRATVHPDDPLAQFIESSMISPEDCAIAFLGIADKATREKDGGEFLDIDGSKIAW